MAKVSPEDPRLDFARDRLRATEGKISTWALMREIKAEHGTYLSRPQVERLRVELGFPGAAPTAAKKKKAPAAPAAPAAPRGEDVIDVLIRQLGSKLQKIAERFDLASINLVYEKGSGTSWTFREPAPERSGRL